jgi:acyl-CoA reductase-like NAD-dependent aldehyde dehydrogenase
MPPAPRPRPSPLDDHRPPSRPAGHAPPDILRPLDGEPVVHKTGFQAFADGTLDATLRQWPCDTVILAGLHLHACVRAAALECLERGYQVLVAEDAVASNDLTHAAATQRWLADRCIRFEPVTSLLAVLDGAAPRAWVHRAPHRTDPVLFEVANAGAGDIADAVAVAQNAGRDWRRTPLSRRRELLGRVAERLEAEAAALAEQMVVEIGKPRTQALEEVHRAALSIRDVIRRAAGQAAPGAQAAGMVRHLPLGVVALITPWNNPLAIALGKIAPALVYGNTVVWKPAPAGTRIAQVVLRLLEEAGVGPRTVSLLMGDQAVARQLAASAGVEAVTVTGSIQAGYAMQDICARRMVPLQAELSGNNAALVWEDADLGHAVEQIAWGAFAFAGQRCTANRRVIVPAGQFETILQRLAAAGNRLAWGNPSDEATVIGPVIHAARRDEIAALVADAQTGGAVERVVLLHDDRAGQPWVKAGAYARPAILCCDRPEHPLVQEETMGPVLVVQRADDFEQALALCNGVRHGLVAALFSRSPERRRQFAERVQAGVLKFNAATAGVDATLPFGGWKASGIGPPEHGEGDRLFYTRIQTVYGDGEV